MLKLQFAVALITVATMTTAMPPGEPVRRPKILGVAHIALFVADVEKSRAYYKNLLGYEEPFQLKNPDGSLSLTFIKINDRQYIELFPEKSPGTSRLNHIALEVDDAEGMRKYLESKGIKVPPKVLPGRTGNLNFTIPDPDGHGVEFVQYMPGSWTSREIGKSMRGPRLSPRMAHLGFSVKNLEQSNRFYGDILGFVETWRGSRDGKILNWTNMRVPDGKDYLEFMLYSEPPSLAQLGTMNHICLEVDNIEATLADLEQRPARKNYTRPLEIRTGINRRRQMNLYDPDGTRSEVMEPGTVDGKPAPSSSAPAPVSK